MAVKSLFDDGRYRVTSALIATPSRFYPIANTTARVRRDPLWVALALTGLIAAALTTYGDLLYAREILTMLATAGLSLLVGAQTSILVLDSPGHPPAAIIARSTRVKALYLAIRDAGSLVNASSFTSIELEHLGNGHYEN